MLYYGCLLGSVFSLALHNTLMWCHKTEPSRTKMYIILQHAFIIDIVNSRSFRSRDDISRISHSLLPTTLKSNAVKSKYPTKIPASYTKRILKRELLRTGNQKSQAKSPSLVTLYSLNSIQTEQIQEMKRAAHMLMNE
jgi:hypothetical protein